MKYLIVCSLIFLFVSNIHAQSNFYKDSLLNSLEKNRFSLNKFNDNSNQKQFIPLQIPQLNTSPKTFDNCILNLSKPSLAYIGNSNHSNIYQSSPDKMYVIKPDSTIQFGMPVADMNK